MPRERGGARWKHGIGKARTDPIQARFLFRGVPRGTRRSPGDGGVRGPSPNGVGQPAIRKLRAVRPLVLRARSLYSP